MNKGLMHLEQIVLNNHVVGFGYMAKIGEGNRHQPVLQKQRGKFSHLSLYRLMAIDIWIF